jgi:hypothetical protein
MSSYGGCSLHLLQPVVDVHVGNTILGSMIIWIAFVFVAFDLKAGGYALRTEGDLVPSATANDETR